VIGVSPRLRPLLAHRFQDATQALDTRSRIDFLGLRADIKGGVMGGDSGGFNVIRREPVLSRMADAQDVDRLPFDREENAIRVPPPAMEQLAEINPKIGGFIGDRAALGIVDQGTDRSEHPGLPPGGSLGRPLRLPGNHGADVMHRSWVNPDRVRHGSLRRD